MVINGTDYTLPLFAVLSFFVMFGGQYFLLKTVRLAFLRHLPWVWVVGMLGLAVATLFGEVHGFIDLRSFFAAIIAGYAAICAAGIWAAHLLNRLKKR